MDGWWRWLWQRNGRKQERKKGNFFILYGSGKVVVVVVVVCAFSFLFALTSFPFMKWTQRHKAKKTTAEPSQDHSRDHLRRILFPDIVYCFFNSLALMWWFVWVSSRTYTYSLLPSWGSQYIRRATYTTAIWPRPLPFSFQKKKLFSKLKVLNNWN